MKTQDIKRMALAYKAVTEKKMDPVGQADADIDNDGDVDKSDKYLHNRRKAIKKAMQDEAADMDAGNVDKAIKHDCATHVTSEQFGAGTCISGMHTIEEQEDGTGIVTHYDVLFEHGIEEMVPVSELTVTRSESHGHSRKKMRGESVEEIEEAGDRAAHYKGATPPEPMTKPEARSEKKMKDGHPIQKGILGKDVEEMGHDDASKAGRITKKAPARRGDNATSDKIQTPVDTTKGGFSEMVNSIAAAYRSMYAPKEIEESNDDMAAAKHEMHWSDHTKKAREAARAGDTDHAVAHQMAADAHDRAGKSHEKQSKFAKGHSRKAMAASQIANNFYKD